MGMGIGPGETLAFVGLGRMGQGMATRLIEAGYTLRVYNRSPERAEPLKARGATVCATPAEAARGASLVVTMLADDGALRAVERGEDGLLAGVEAGAVHVSMSTVSPDAVRGLQTAHRERGAELVSAPVMGRPDAAAAGQVWILAAGPADLEERCRPLFEALARGSTWLGDDPGLANALKIAANFLLLGSMEVLAEAFTLVEKQGLDRQRFAEVAGRLFQGGVFQGYMERMLAGQLEPAGFAADLALKDAGLLLGLARSGAAPAPVGSVVWDRLLTAVAQGRGQQDATSLIEVARSAAGLG